MLLRLRIVLCAFTFLVAHVSLSSHAVRESPTYRPKRIALGNAPCSDVQSYQEFSLTSSNPVATLDYGVEVAGYPTFTIEQIQGRVQVEIKYSEEFEALKSCFSDGPWPYAVALANTYRVETFEIKEVGLFSSSLLQGGQRWQSIRLLTNGSVTFSAVGFVASVLITNLDKLPGGFISDNESLNKIWQLGARAVSLSCLEKGTQKKMWVVNDDGAFVRGMRSGISAKGPFFENYTLEFDGMIERAGLGWVVAHPLASPAKGIQLNLVGSLPANTTFINTNTSLTPPNTVILGYGYSFVNQTTLTSYVLDTFDIPFSVQEGTWYRIKTVLSQGQYVSVSIDGTQIFNISTKAYYVGSSPFPGVQASISLRGSFGFGGWQDQAGHFRNTIVYDSSNNSVLYSNSMVYEEQVIAEYGVHENYASVCLDGPKRDRLVWLGDFFHTVRIISSSTSRMDLVKGTLQFLLDWQIPSGLIPYAPPIGYNASVALDAFALGGGDYLAGYEVASIILPDYQILGILAFTNYVHLTNDFEFARRTWDAWQLNMDWVLKNIDPITGLLSLIGAFLGPADKGSAINCALVEALNSFSEVAHVLEDTEAYLRYRSAATKLIFAINKELWIEKTGIYSLSPSLPEDFSVNSIAFCITSGTANATQAKRLLLALPSLKLGPGYKDSTLVNGSDPSTNISPNTNGFLLSALLSQPNGAQQSWDLLQSLWPKMFRNKETTTGASWEYVNVNVDPGLGFFTSLAHPWGGAPTYLLVEWVVGIQPAKGIDGFGFRNWVMNPDMGTRFGLKQAQGRVSTPFGQLEAAWKITSGTMHVVITASENTRGTFQLGRTTRVLSGAKRYQFQVEI